MEHDHKNSLHRVKTIIGHMQGIERMLQADEYCVDIIKQIQAVQSSLNKVAIAILDQHLNSCLINAVRGDDPDERQRVLKEIIELYETTRKV